MTPPGSSAATTNTIDTNGIVSPTQYCEVSSDLPHNSSTIKGEVSGHSVTDCHYNEPYLEVGAQIWYDWGLGFGNQIGGNTDAKVDTNYLKVGAGGACKKDMVKSGGENVSSLEVEHCLAQHPAVSAVSVIGLPHPYWGEAVTALVIREPGADSGEEALVTYARERLAGFKVPKRIVFVEEFPKTGTGKIQKNVLRQLHHELYAAPDGAGRRKEEGE